MNITKHRSKLAGYLYKLTLWVAPSHPRPTKSDKPDTGYDWGNEDNFGERPY